MSFKLEANEIRNLESLHKKVKDGRIRDRIKCVVALSKDKACICLDCNR